MRRTDQAPAGNRKPGKSLAQKSPRRLARHPFLSAAIFFLFALLLAAQLRADTISGTVKDSSGAAVAGARIEITGSNLSQPLILTSGNSGEFAAPNLTRGKYSVQVAKDGFNDDVTSIELSGASTLTVTLTVAQQQTSVNVSAIPPKFANSDPVYRQLRDATLGTTHTVENFTLTIDVGTFQLKTGTLTLLRPVNNVVTGAIFIGEGHFTLRPTDPISTREMVRRNGSPSAEEDFTEAVFRFDPGSYPQFAKALGAETSAPAHAASAFQEWRNKIRQRHQTPQGFTQELLEDETMDNVDADVLAAIYNPQHPAFINAYISGTPHKDLRFFMRERVGAIPQLDSPEEVALINYNGGADNDGVWYSQHLASEQAAGLANSRQDRRLFATHRYVIETDIAKNDHLSSRATIAFQPLIPGERVMKFGLLTSLRVTRVTDQNGQEQHFIQEDRNKDGSFYAILDAAPEMGLEHSITVEYSGDKVLYNAGNGSYYVGARESWYPNLNGYGFGEKALYDLTFKVPASNTVVSVGKLAAQSTEAGFAVSHWVTPVPVAVAGFNYGRYKKMDYPDTITHYNLFGYYLEELPDILKAHQDAAFLSAMSPTAMTKYVLDQARAQMQLCTLYFGRAPYDNLNITEQPDLNFGQSWPGLIYLPILAYTDSTQRWAMFGQDSGLSGFVQEVTPHEVAHQWFGHAVVWASYHDEWLSEGFAEFAAGLFLQQAMGPKWQKDYIAFWERQRLRILQKNSFGLSPNDAGPLWLGLRLDSPHTDDAYDGVIYSKGAYVLQMLRSIFYEDRSPDENKDQAFIDMMHDFVDSHRDSPASTESFKAIAEKHMPKLLDLQRNGRLDWFFNEWVYGTDIPRYQFKYDIQPADGGKFRVHAEITQSEVTSQFAMFVPVFADFGNGLLRIGQVGMVGNSTRTVDFIIDRQPKKVEFNAYKDILER